ncbi:MAG: hypothetical protein ACLVJH_15620 [Faecalibacterium prausnitzii]
MAITGSPSGIGKNFGDTKGLQGYLAFVWSRARRWPSSARPAPARPPCCAA